MNNVVKGAMSEMKPESAATESVVSGGKQDSVGSVRTPGAKADAKGLLYEADKFFNRTYNAGLKLSGTTTDSVKRRERFYNLAQVLLHVQGLRGSVAECGCWKGLSSYIICNYQRREDERFNGSGFHVFDSFQGLSEPSNEDALTEHTRKILKKDFGVIAGAFGATVEEVRKTLQDFPDVQIHSGWIPNIFTTQPNGHYRLVHIDVDLYKPTKASLDYFYPRLVAGGIIVCDDYGSLAWPGAQRAVEEFCRLKNLRFISLSTGQAIIIKEGGFTSAARRVGARISRYMSTTRK
jgi:hypothetical protein